MTKTYATWLSTRVWCVGNPGKTAAIVTPFGVFTIKFEPKVETPLLGMERIEYGD